LKKYVVVLAALVAFGCAHKQEVKAPEIVASCFGDGENQDVCKAERVSDENKVVTTRCIGAQNRNALASLRGKCVEKICGKGSNTDCQLRGEVGVLDQYSELMRHRYFDDEEGGSQSAANSSQPKKISKVKGKKGKKAIEAAQQELDVDPTAQLPKMPAKPEPVVQKPAPKPASQEPAEPAPINVTLKADTAKSPSAPVAVPSVRKPASVSGIGEGFKKVCVAKNDAKAPTGLRGKCATRTCNEGKCTYGGRKEMFEYVSRSSN
jgi:hypothetical protein